MGRRNVRWKRGAVNQDIFADLGIPEPQRADPFGDLSLGQDEPRRVRTASPSISEIEHRESYDAIRKRNLLDSVKDQEDIRRAENPDFLDKYGEALKQTALHPLETAKAIPKAVIGAATDIFAPSVGDAASLNQPNSQPRRQLAARFGPSYLTDAEPFGKGVTGEQRALGIAQTAATVLAPGASLGRVLGFGALAGAASSPDDPMLGAAMGTTLGAAARSILPRAKAPAYEPPPVPKVTGIPAAPTPAVPAGASRIDRYRTLRFGLGDKDPSVDIRLSTSGAPVRRPAPRPAVEPGPDAATASFGDPEFLPTKYRGRELGNVRRRPGPKQTNAPGTVAAEAEPFSTKGAAVRRPAPGPFDDLALAEKAEAPPPPPPKAAEAPRTFLADGPLRRTAPGETVDGLRVGKKISNKRSIPASLTEPSVLKGVRVMAMSDFDSAPRDLFYAADDLARTEALAETIRRSGRIDPLIVVVGDKGGPYILEGGHRLGALHILGKKEFPALVVSEAADVDVRLARRDPAPAPPPAAESQPFAMGGPESRIPEAPRQPRGPRTEPPVLSAPGETAHAGKGVIAPEAPDLTPEYPAGVPRAMDPKTLANAVKRSGLTDESAEVARKQILDSGYQPVRVTFADQAKVAEQLAGTLGVDVKALRPDLAKRMSVPDMYARITRASTNVKLIEALSKEVTGGTLTPDEAGNLTAALERLETENRNIYGDVLVAGSQKGRELGAMRMIARLSTDPAVWEVQAMRKLGGKPLSDQVRGTVRRMAAEVAAACAL